MLIQVLAVLQLILAILLTVLILIQQQGSGLGAAFGGTGGVHSVRRGPEKVVFSITIVVAILFCLASIATVIIK